MQGIYWLAVNLLVSLEGLCSIHLTVRYEKQKPQKNGPIDLWEAATCSAKSSSSHNYETVRFTAAFTIGRWPPAVRNPNCLTEAHSVFILRTLQPIYSMLSPGLPSGLFSSSFPINASYAVLYSPMHATHPATWSEYNHFISTHINWMGNEYSMKTQSKSITVVDLITRNNQPHTSDCFLDARPDVSGKRITAHNSVLHDSGFYSL
jgi:hypothetical protein